MRPGSNTLPSLVGLSRADGLIQSRTFSPNKCHAVEGPADIHQIQIFLVVLQLCPPAQHQVCGQEELQHGCCAGTSKETHVEPTTCSQAGSSVTKITACKASPCLWCTSRAGSCDVGDGWLNCYRTDLLTEGLKVRALEGVKRCGAALLTLLRGLHDTEQNTGLSPEVALGAQG